MSQHKAVTEADIQDIVEEAGFDVRSVHFDTVSGGRVAYIRLEPPGTGQSAVAEPAQQVKPMPAGVLRHAMQTGSCILPGHSTRAPGH